MGTLEKSQFHRVAECLIAIDTSEIHKRALEDATNDATISASRIEELKLRSDNMQKNIFQIVGFYLLFQSVLITVVAQSSILHRNNLWSPLALSAAAAVSSLIPVWQNGMAIADLRGDMHDEENIHKVAVRARQELRRLGIAYSFPTSTDPKSGPQSKKKSPCVYFLPYALILLFIICFTLLILISQWRILSTT